VVKARWGYSHITLGLSVNFTIFFLVINCRELSKKIKGIQQLAESPLLRRSTLKLASNLSSWPTPPPLKAWDETSFPIFPDDGRNRRGGLVNLGESLGVLLHIYLGGSDRLMPEHLFEIKHINALGSHHGGKGVAKFMSMKIHATIDFKAPDNTAKASIREGIAVFGQP
jgi:hypothetical protein